MPERLNSYFSTSPELRQLSGKAGQLLALQQQYEQVAPVSLMRHSRVLQFDRGVLTLAANNGAIAAKLRQLLPELTLQLQNRGYEITGILVRVQVTLTGPEHTPIPLRLSASGQQRLLELAVELPDSPLKNVLQRFADKAGQPAKSGN